MNNVRLIENLELLNIGMILESVSATFQDISFGHIYCENNYVVDQLSKEALTLNKNLLCLKELSYGRVSSHREIKLLYL